MAEDLLNPAPAASKRPAEVPEKFWDEAAQQVRVDALLKSYLELERRMSRGFAPPGDDAPEDERTRFRRAMGVPDAPDGYAITPAHELAGSDPEVNARLHQAGFTPGQAQLVYDLAAERLLPLVAEAAADYEAERQRDRLRAHFGGEDGFARAAKRLGTWGRAHLPPAVFEALSTTFEGIVAMDRMMAEGEPRIARKAEPTDTPDEAQLRAMVRDPRYWKSRDPAFVARVSDGFRRLTERTAG